MTLDISLTSVNNVSSALECYDWPSLSLRRHAHGPLAKRLMHMAHLAGNTSGVSKSSSDWLNYTGDVCVAFFNIPPGNKNGVSPNSLTKEESRCVYNCDDEHLSGSTERWIFKSM